MSAERAGGEEGRAWGVRHRRPLVLGGVVVAFLLVVGVVVGLAAFRYFPALDEARAMRADLETMVVQVQEAGFDIDRATVDELEAELATARTRLNHLRELVESDLLIGIARGLPPTAENVAGAELLLVAAGSVLDAVDAGLPIARDLIEIRERREAGTASQPVLAQLVALMAASREQAASAAASVADARQSLAEVPDGLIPQLINTRDAMSARIDRYAPLLDVYMAASERLPAILGSEGPRRYLVLTQDPAELRPTGGFIGSYGIVSFDGGELTGYRFQDVTPLDVPWDYPRIEPPQELSDYLLGPRQPWQFADANWSPDFPTSARDALRLYVNESGDRDIDGVLAITTYTIDELLKVTGPVAVPDYGVRIAAGETTLKVLQETRIAPPGQDRKAFLPAFAERMLAALFSLPPQSWGELLATTGTLRDTRLLLAWFADPADQALALRTGIDGAVRQDAGDYLFPVEANVTPASKLSAWTSRAMDLEVQVDEVGNARNTLEVTWSNDVETPAGASYRAMENVGGRILGMYFRVLVPEQSRVEEVVGGTLAPVTDPAVIEQEAGRTVIGTYLKIPAGRTEVRYVWTSAYAADADSEGGTYRLTIQRQPGAQPGPLRITICAPAGSRISAASSELIVDGSTATLETTFDRDITVGVRYAP